jgi:hypothetical protein
MYIFYNSYFLLLMKHMFRYVIEKNNSYFGREIMILTSQTQIIHSNIGVMLHCIMKESPQKSTFTTQNTPSSGELVFIYLLLRRIKKNSINLPHIFAFVLFLFTSREGECKESVFC